MGFLVSFGDVRPDKVSMYNDETNLLRLRALGSSLRSGVETCLLLLLSLGAVLVEKFEELCGGVLVQSVGELGDGGGDLQALTENDLLALEANIFGPFDETGQVSLWLDVLTYMAE